MHEFYRYFINTQWFSVKFYIHFFTYWILNNVTLLTAFYAIGVKTSAKKSLSIALVVTVFSMILREYVLPPYSMVINHLFAGLLIVFFYKITLLRGFLGVFFSMVLLSMGAAFATYNLVMLNYARVNQLLNIPVFLCLGYLEYIFNYIYIILAKKYQNLTLKSIFEDEV